MVQRQFFADKLTGMPDCSRAGGFGRAPNPDAVGPNRFDDCFVY